jgi:hypothetical protein
LFHGNLRKLRFLAATIGAFLLPCGFSDGYVKNRPAPPCLAEFFDKTLVDAFCYQDWKQEDGRWILSIQDISGGRPSHAFGTRAGGEDWVQHILPRNWTMQYPQFFPGEEREPIAVDPFSFALEHAGVPIGIALNGVPFYSALTSSGIDPVRPQDAVNHLFDDCAGSLEKGMFYGYRVMPPCLIDPNVRVDHPTLDWGHAEAYSPDLAKLAFDAFRTPPVQSLLLGVMLDGNPIYGPLTEDEEHRLDECNGIWEDGAYRYHVTSKFPYLIGCLGPPGGVKARRDCPRGTYGTVEGQCLPCPRGTFGALPGVTNSSCSGACSGGYLCAEGSTTADPTLCGSAKYYCSPGAEKRELVPLGHYSTPLPEAPSSSLWSERVRSGSAQCEAGYFCKEGVRLECPPGRFGISEGLSSEDCSGSCPVGFYCPAGTSEPLPCPAGRYGDSVGLSSAECSGACAPGFFCLEGSTNSTSASCPDDVWGEDEGNSNALCSSRSELSTLCSIGNFCPAAELLPPESQVIDSVNSSETSGVLDNVGSRPCEPGYECVQEFSRPCPAGTFGEAGECIQCEEGYWCPEGSTRDTQIPCPAGMFGSGGAATSSCSGRCRAGYFCPEQSTSPVQHECGSGTVYENEGFRGGDTLYCPPGSAEPFAVSAGFFAVGGTSSTRHSQIECNRDDVPDGWPNRCPETTI